MIDFEHVADNVFHVTWEWKIEPPARKGNRADVMFVVNGVPVVIVEHIVKAITGACDRVIVLDAGKKLAEGTVGEIVENPCVIEAYLGAHHAGG